MAVATSAAAEQPPGDAAASVNDEIVVTARRREESAQDVPLVVNALTGDGLAGLNIRRFEDIQSTVPGLSLASDPTGIGTSSSIRGVNYDVKASGNNGTIEFYLNDAPLASGFLFQSMFDISQVEVLRGPQGTLRGRASPSGSVTVTTRRPDLQEPGGYVTVTRTNIGGIHVDGAGNVPIINGVLGVRVAGLFDDNEGNRVRSVNAPGIEPSTRTRAVRVTASLEPTDSLSFLASYQRMTNRIRSFDQRESMRMLDPAAPARPASAGATDPDDPLIRASNRLGVTDLPRDIRQVFEVYNWQGGWRFAGQQLNYVGALSKSRIDYFEPTDFGDFFGPSYPQVFQTFGQTTYSRTTQESHELRLSSEERLLDLFDYIIGGFINRLEPPTDLTRPTPFFAITSAIPTPAAGAPTTCLSPTLCSGILDTAVQRRGRSLERSLFGSLTLHLGDATEISGGLRAINYENRASLAVNGATVPAADEDSEFNAVIYQGAIKHRFNANLMAYASIGSSWRPGINVVGDFSLARSELENSFLILPPEKSRSYEIGIKSDWLDKRLRLNISAFHQEFDNYPFRVPGSGVFFVSTDPARTGGTVRSVKNFNFVAAVPVKVDGVEVEASFQATPDWNLGLSGSYALGRIRNGLIPCNDYFPRDGLPDASPRVPTVAEIEIATGGDTISACTVNYRSSFAPLVTLNLQSQYSAPVTDDVDGYLRGLLTWYGNSQNDPANAVDDVEGYALLNLHAGVRDSDGAWEIALYGKNITATRRVLSRGSAPLTTSYATARGGQTGVSTYRDVTYTQPREFGISVRYAFGSR